MDNPTRKQRGSACNRFIALVIVLVAVSVAGLAAIISSRLGMHSDDVETLRHSTSLHRLTKALWHDEPNVQLASAARLSELGSDPQSALADIHARLTTSLLPAESSVPLVDRILKESHEKEMRRLLVATLGNIGPRAKVAIPTIVRYSVLDLDISDRDLAVRALAQIKADPSQLAMLYGAYLNDDTDDRVVERAARLISKCGKEAIPTLHDRIKSTNSETVKWYAIESLESIKDWTSEGTAALMLAMESDSARIRVVAIDALAKKGPAAAPALELLRRELSRRETPGELYDSRPHAIAAIASLGPAAVPLLPEIEGLVTDEKLDIKIRVAAMDTVLTIEKIKNRSDTEEVNCFCHVGENCSTVDLSSFGYWRSSFLTDLRNLKGLTTLILPRRGRVSGADLREVGQLATLVKLDFNGSSVSTADLSNLWALSHLTCIDLSGTDVTHDQLTQLQGFTGLTQLNIGQAHVTDHPNLNKLERLTELDVSHNWLAHTGKQQLGELTNLTSLDVSGCHILDADLKDLGNLKALRKLHLRHNMVTDEGLEHLVGLTHLAELDLSDNGVTSAGLKVLTKLKSLNKLNLSHTKVTDDDLEHLCELTNLTELNLSDTKVTDAGLQGLVKLKALKTLNLGGTYVTDVGLSDVGTLKALSALGLGGTKITDIGLSALSELTNLTSLSLDHTQITDAGLIHLRNLTSLASLSLYETKVTGPGLNELKALTRLTTLTLRTDEARIDFREPGGLRSLETLNLNCIHVTLVGLGHLSNLKFLNLQLATAGDESLIGIGQLRNLRTLWLTHCYLTDSSLKELRNLTNLTDLDLCNNALTAEGLTELRELKQLTKLNLGGTGVTDLVLKELRVLKNLKELELGNTNVTDAGVRALRKLPCLQHVSLDGTKVTDPTGFRGIE